MTTSPTNAFEDAEIAREELLESARIAIEDGEYNTLPLVQALVNALEARQSPASTTAADAWDEALDLAASFSHFSNEQHAYFKTRNPYRVAAPEGDGGNE